MLSNKYYFKCDFFLLNSILCFCNVILEVSLELRHVGGVLWHFITSPLSQCTAVLWPLDVGWNKSEQISHERGNVEEDSQEFSVVSSMSISGLSKTYSVDNFWLTPSVVSG